MMGIWIKQKDWVYLANGFSKKKVADGYRLEAYGYEELIVHLIENGTSEEVDSVMLTIQSAICAGQRLLDISDLNNK